MPKTKVLIVDDEVDYLGLMKERIESWGYEVITATEGQEALVIIKKELPGIVILDYLMPKMDGTEVLRQIRKFNKSLAVIMFTAHADMKNIKGAQKLGVSAFIPKLSTYSSDIQGSLHSALDMAEKKIMKKEG